MSLLHGLGYVLLLLLLSLAIKKEWLAASALWLLFMLPQLLSQGLSSPLGLAFGGVTWALIVLVVARMGLLAMTAVQFFFFMNLFFTYTTDFKAWYAGGTIFALVVCAGVAVYGFHTALAGQPLLRSERLD